MTRKGRPGGLVASRQVKEACRCVYCGRKTRTTAGLTNTPLARYPHSIEKQETPPLCAAMIEGRQAQRRVS